MLTAYLADISECHRLVFDMGPASLHETLSVTASRTSDFTPVQTVDQSILYIYVITPPTWKEKHRKKEDTLEVGRGWGTMDSQLGL